MHAVQTDNKLPDFDSVLETIADYTLSEKSTSQLAIDTAFHCLIDSIGCGLLALNYPECANLLGPWVPGNTTEKGARVLGTSHVLDPIKAAFDNGALIRWLDYNDTWLAAEWGHPSDNLGALLSVMDYLSQQDGQPTFKVHDLLDAMIKAYEIQGIMALENSFNAVGLDHVVLVKLASTALSTKLMGGNKDDILKALSQAFVDGQSLRTYRHAPNTGSRKSWAAGDATSRAVRLAMVVLQGEQGYPSVLSAKRWGFYDVLFEGKPFEINRKLDSYVMENILFKISYPAEFHGQTAVEAALKLHHQLDGNVDNIKEIKLTTQKSGFNIINKEGPLHNPADRDHCLQYMVAAALLEGKLTSDSYTNETASNGQIDALRDKMHVTESDVYSSDYLDPEKRSIANKVELTLNDGQTLSEEIHYPVGHKRRREEGIPLLMDKFEKNLYTRFDKKRVEQILALTHNNADALNISVPDFMKHFIN